MTHLLYFGAGMLFYIIAIPVIESIVSLIETALKAKEYQISVKIAEYTSEIAKIQSDEEDISAASAIGFAMPEEIEYYEEDDDE